MRLKYRVIVEQIAAGRYQASARAFQSLHVFGNTASEAIEAARTQIASMLKSYKESGRCAPPPDREAVKVALVSVPFETSEYTPPELHIQIASGKVYKNGVELPMRGTSLELLLALAVEGRELSVDALCERIYPGMSPDQAYSALKMCIYRARKHLGAPNAIKTGQRGYELADHVTVDVRVLPHILHAIRASSVDIQIESRLEPIFEQLIRGRPAACQSWEWFVVIERDLCNAARQIGLYLANRALREGTTDRAMEISHTLAALDRLDEAAYELEIRVHLARGDRASALQTYRRYADDLQLKNRIDPSPALRALLD